ncbi:MAG: hypothetical protein HY699_25540 [Deltaproteobacteria bacterium]|nr:hypothetical protein [Deltaproteobacteria bacterium]
MAGFEFDMAFTTAEVVTGTARLLDQLGYRWQRRDHVSGSVFAFTLADGNALELCVEPLPAERQTYPTWFPRTLLSAHSAGTEGAELATLRRALVLAFLRVMG